MPPTISLFDVQAILPSLQSGDVVITPNQRLASRITNAYSLHCHEHNKKVIIKPLLYSLNNWVESCWQQLLITANPLAMGVTPLTTAQELLVWEEVVAASDLGSALLRPAATAQQAASAYHLLLDWDLDPASEELKSQFHESEDAAAFIGWVEQFERCCSDNEWLPKAKVTGRVLAAFLNHSLPSVDTILVVGFESIPPFYKRLLTTAGKLQYQPIGEKMGIVNVVECDSEKQEIQAAAIWAKQRLKHNAFASIAIVVPELAQKREWVQRILLETFDPGFNQPLNDEGQLKQRNNLPFNFSAGYPLIESPVISVAIDVISLALPLMELSRLEFLCQSPFLTTDVCDFELNSRLIKSLRAQRELNLSTSRFRQLANKIAGDNEWLFAQSLQKMGNCSRDYSIHKSRSRKEWLQLFTEMLACAGWPGLRPLDSIEYQQVKHWQQAADEYVGQDTIIAEISLSQAISQLKGVLSRLIFQPQTAESSLQVLGTLEAAGLQFTDLWLSAMSERQWPAAPSPNPLLPYSLQRQHSMPHASAERELQFSTNISHRFLHSADNIIISSPLVIDDSSVAVSRIFQHHSQKTIDQLLGRKLSSMIPLAEIRRRHQKTQQLENYSLGNAPQLKVDEVVHGGSSLFASQSACPFKAFAIHRLKQKPLEKPQLGLSASDRGSLLHYALELLWKKLKNQQALLALSEKELASLCEDCSRYAVTQLGQRLPTSFGSRYQSLEIKRLKKLLLAWLELEKQRANFSVAFIEDRKEFQFDRLKLEARIDRIDQLDDGSQLVIDYKSSKPSINRWWGDRPEEPQLPLYSLLTDSEAAPVSGIAFAQVRSDGCSLKGVGDKDSPETIIQWQDKYQNSSGVKDWQQLKNYWEKILTALAIDFINGRADVDPKQRSLSCQYCDLASLCRIDHKSLVTSSLLKREVDNDASH